MRDKLIWEFRGIEAQGTAEHHAKHLEEFAQKNELKDYETGVETFTKYFSSAYLTVNKDDSDSIIRILRPQKKQVLDK